MVRQNSGSLARLVCPRPGCPSVYLLGGDQQAMQHVVRTALERGLAEIDISTLARATALTRAQVKPSSRRPPA